jgi:hypothetical protein
MRAFSFLAAGSSLACLPLRVNFSPALVLGRLGGRRSSPGLDLQLGGMPLPFASCRDRNIP